MARFSFSLEPLLKLRRLEEDQKKRGFLSSLQLCRLKEAEIEEISRRREEAKARCRELLPGRIEIEDLLRARRFLNVLFQRLSEKRVELQALRPALDEARAAYRKAAARRRVVEKVRERKWREYLREEDRRERRELDEAGQNLFWKARAESREPAGGDR
jgi:flagellar FliJ protein